MPTTRTEPEIRRTNDVLARLNVSRSSLHRRRQNGTFPKPFQLGKHAVGWRRAAIDAWLADRPGEWREETSRHSPSCPTLGADALPARPVHAGRSCGYGGVARG